MFRLLAAAASCASDDNDGLDAVCATLEESVTFGPNDGRVAALVESLDRGSDPSLREVADEIEASWSVMAGADIDELRGQLADLQSRIDVWEAASATLADAVADLWSDCR